MPSLFDPLTFPHGGRMSNRFMLAPLTNKQSRRDGTLSQEEHDWLAMRAKGGFGSVMTAAAFVQYGGKAFKGQLGIHDDACLPGLERLASALRSEGSLALVQLHHGGIRSPESLTGLPTLGPSADEETGARAMTGSEIEAMIEAFVAAAERAEAAGFDGVELHGAHSYLLCAFLSTHYNRRIDDYGGPLENRARPIRAIIDGIRRRCKPGFTLGLRLSAERMGVTMPDMLVLAAQIMDEGMLDFLDMSLWDVFKEPEEPEFKGKSLLQWFAGLNRGRTRLGVAGKIRTVADSQACLDAGADFVLIGRAAIAHHDFPRRASTARDYGMPALPLSPAHLSAEGISPVFLDYLQSSFPGLVAEA